MQLPAAFRARALPYVVVVPGSGLSPPASFSSKTTDPCWMSTSSLAHAFAKSYYTRLSQRPELAYRFYGSDSTLLHGTEGDSKDAEAIRGQAQIKAKLAERQQAGTIYLIRDVTSVSTAQNCVLVTVLGELAVKGSDPQQFCQTFVLARTADNALYILTDVLRVFNPEFDADVEPATGAVEEARELVENVKLKDAEPEPAEPAAVNPNPNSWASVLAKPQPAPVAPKAAAAPRVVGSTTAAVATAPRPPGAYSAFLKLSSSTTITKAAVVKALAPFGPLSNLQIDAAKKRGYVDFPDKRMFDKALKTARVKIPGGRDSIEILKRFTGPPPSAKPSGAGANSAAAKAGPKAGASRRQL